MYQSSLPLRLDTLGGLSHTDNIDNFSASESDTSKIKDYLQKQFIPLKNYPKIIFFIYIAGFVIMTILLVNIFLVTSVDSNAILAMLVICPFLLIILGGVGGYYENKWKKAVHALQKKVLLLTENRCSIEPGYVLRCGSNRKRPLNICNSRQGYLILFDLQNYAQPIKRGTLYDGENDQDKCVLSPFTRTSVQRHKLVSAKAKAKAKKKEPLSNPLDSAKKKNKFGEVESQALQPQRHMDPVSTKTIEMGQTPEDQNEVISDPQNPYKMEPRRKDSLDALDERELDPPARRFSETDLKDEDIWRQEKLN